MLEQALHPHDMPRPRKGTTQTYLVSSSGWANVDLDLLDDRPGTDPSHHQSPPPPPTRPAACSHRASEACVTQPHPASLTRTPNGGLWVLSLGRQGVGSPRSA